MGESKQMEEITRLRLQLAGRDALIAEAAKVIAPLLDAPEAIPVRWWYWEVKAAQELYGRLTAIGRHSKEVENERK